MTTTATFTFIRNPITDLGLPTDLDDRLAAALDGPHGHEIEAAVEAAVNEQLAAHGWDGEWTRSASEIVTAVLAQYPTETTPTTATDQIAADVRAELDVIAEIIAEQAAGYASIRIAHAVREGAEFETDTDQGVALTVQFLDADGDVIAAGDRSYVLPSSRDDEQMFWTAFQAADEEISRWLGEHGVSADADETFGTGWAVTFPAAAWQA